VAVTGGDGAGAFTDPVADGVADPAGGVVLAGDVADSIGDTGAVVAGAVVAGAVVVVAAGADEDGVAVGAAPFTTGASISDEVAAAESPAGSDEPAIDDDEQPAMTAIRRTPARAVAGHGMREVSILQTFPGTQRTGGMTTRVPVEGIAMQARQVIHGDHVGRKVTAARTIPSRGRALRSPSNPWCRSPPARAITISSPASTRSSSRDRCALVSWTFTVRPLVLRLLIVATWFVSFGESGAAATIASSRA